MASHGRYTILGKLADGGMAEIFLAVQHGSIVQVLDLGVAAGRYFLALELVDGWDLEKILQRAYKAEMVFPTALGLYVVAEVCRALAYAHGKSRDGKPLGIVHRDISPNNVLLSGEGEVKLADFGIAKAQRKREQTAAGVIKGKVAYMSPEQARGELIDRRSDIFSVGSMLYRMMTDRLPFEANNDLESLLRVQKAEFPPPEQAKPTIGMSVGAIIRRAMRLHPAERYQTADEMLVEVERVLRTEFHSAGQTELKAWLEQLGRRDNAPSIGRAPRDEAGVVKDAVGTDLSIGTSFELRDLEQSNDQTEMQRGRTPSPEVRSAPTASLMEAPPLPRSGHTAEIVKPGAHVQPRGRSGGFWFGVILTLGAVVGARYLWVWAENRGVMTALGIGGNDGKAHAPSALAPPTPPAPPPAEATGPSPSPSPSPSPTPTPSPSPSNAGQPAPAAPPLGTTPATAEKTDKAEKTTVVDAGSPGRAAATAAGSSPDAHPAVAEAAPAEPKPEGADTDEDALIRKAVPNAENAVIGEDEAEADTKAPAKPKPPARPHVAPGKPAAEIPRVETAILHFTSVPAGAVVKTKARVLGRTPIALHFKTGNTYEIVLIKRGYEPATRKVSVHNTKDRKVAVALKKTPPPKHSFFHPHR